MNTEQLNTARLARWSQNGEARLTLEAAAEWLETIGFCPYLPPGSAGFPPAPSFLEAVVGRPAQVPSAGECSRADALLGRMVENAAIVPLKMGSALGEDPDFVASPEALRYLYALRGNKNFKSGPPTVGNDKVTPLALHCWQAIEQRGPLDLSALQPILGRDITEAAIARALQELWAGLYVFPSLRSTGQAAQWELLPRRFPSQVAAGSNTGHAEAQSAMVSLYLHAVVAAAEEDVLRFLSPLAPQSKLREVMRGLGSMRQLDMIDVGGRPHVCLQGGLLPEMVAQLSEEPLRVPEMAAFAVADGIEIERAPEPSYREAGDRAKFAPKKFVPRKFVPRESSGGKPAGRRWSAPPASGRPASKNIRPPGFAASAASSEGRDFRRSGPERPRFNDQPRFNDRPQPKDRPYFKDRPYSHKDRSYSKDRPRLDDRPPSSRGPGERASRWEKSGEEGPLRPSAGRPGERKPFRASGFKSGGFKSAGAGPAKPWAKRPSFGAEGSREHNAEDRPRRWDKPADPDAAPPRGKKPFATKSSGFRPAGSKTAGFKPRKFSSPGAGGPKPWKSKGPKSSDAEAQPFAKRSGTSKPFGKTTGGAKPWKKRASAEGNAESDSKRRETPGSDTKSPGGSRAAKPFWAKNPRGGKGSAAGSRGQRPPGGKKSGGKKGGRKK